MAKPKEEVIIIPKKISVFEDRKTMVKTVAFPFTFNNGKNGILSITHLDPSVWNPSEDIESLTIKFKDDETDN